MLGARSIEYHNTTKEKENSAATTMIGVATAGARVGTRDAAEQGGTGSRAPTTTAGGVPLALRSVLNGLV